MIRIAAALLLLILSIPSASFAQSDKQSEGAAENKTEKISNAKDLFVGTWRLLAIEEDIAGKKTIYATIVGTAIKRNYELTEDQLIIKSTFTDKSDNTERTRKTIWKRVR